MQDTSMPLPTMILCGPNAMYAEQVQYNSDLLDFYIDNGINVMVYNYRGYGLSQGVPSIKVSNIEHFLPKVTRV